MKKNVHVLLRIVMGLLLCMSLCLVAVPQAYAAENITEFFGGDGSAENPYLVGTKAHLDNVRNYPNAHFLLVTDLEFTSSDFSENGIYYNDGAGWVPIGNEETPFTGTFSGDGHTIFGLTVLVESNVTAYGGLFGYSTGTIAQLNVTDARCSVNTSVASAGTYAGGIAGYNGGTIQGCSYSGTVYASVSSGNRLLDGTAYAGGIAGNNAGTIESSTNTAQARANTAGKRAYTGGVAGRSTGLIEDCTNSGKVGDSSSCVTGGIVGYSTAEIKNCINRGEVDSTSEDTSYAGGIAGYASDKILGCENFGNVTSYSREKSSVAYIGGIVGYAGGEISGCTNHGAAYGDASRNKISTTTYVTVHVGGIAGYGKKTIDNCVHLGEVSAVSYSYRPIQSSASFASVYATAYVGGIAGTSEDDISSSYATGGVTLYTYEDKTYVNSRNYYNDGSGYVGGLAGEARGSINNCYSAGNVCSRSKASPFVGGLVGHSDGAITNSYTIGMLVTVKAYENQGAVAGAFEGELASVYYLKWTGVDTDPVGVSFEQADMNVQETYAGFDFETVWYMDDTMGAPALISNPYAPGEGNTEMFAGGSGRLFDPYRIETAAHLNNVRNYPYSFFKLVSDITFTSADFTSSGAFYNNGTYWTAISFFGGVLDGNGHSISGLRQTLTATHGGMIAVNGGTICNLTLKDVTITHTGDKANTYVGALAGENQGVIEDCVVTGSSGVSCTLTGDYKGYAGGITGYNKGIITGCSNAGTIFSGKGYQKYTYAGGIAALNNKTVTRCSNAGKVEGRYCAGGIVAWNDEDADAVQYCSNSGTITTTAKNSFTNGDPTASYAGGITGYNCVRTEYCFNTGTVTANGFNGGTTYSSANAYGGGIAGYGCYIYNSYNTGAITAKSGYMSYAGGISGKSLILSYCYNVGSVTTYYSQGTQNNYSGAIVGSGTVYSNNYYLSTSASAGTGSGSDYAARCTAEQMKQRSTFTNLDFYNVWMIDAYRSYKYPILRNNCMYPVSSLTITKAPDHPLQTVEGIAPAIEGCTVRITYADGHTVTTQATSDMIPAASYAYPGTNTTALEYCGVSSNETITISVAEKTLVELLILGDPYKTIYMEGEELDTEGLYVAAVYNNHEEHQIIPESITGYDSSVGTKTITVSYQGLTATFTVDVCACESIAITTRPDKLTYVQGQPLSTEGGVVTATLTNGAIRSFPLSQAQITYPIDKTGTVEVTATLFERTAAYYITVNPRVAAELILLSTPSKTVYFVGEELDPTGGVLRVVFESEDAYTEEIALTADMLSGFNSTQAGYPTVTVTYCGKNVTFLTRVRDYGLAASHDGEKITVTVGAIPENCIVLVAQYDVSGKQIDCQVITESTILQMDPSAHAVYAYLVDGHAFSPYIQPIEVTMDMEA